MISANILEPGTTYYIKNIFKDGGSSAWAGASNTYGIKTYYYTTPLILGHTYYAQYTYKYSLSSTSATKPSWVELYYDGGNAGHLTQQFNIPSANTEYTFYEVFAFNKSVLRDYSYKTVAEQFDHTTFFHSPYLNVTGLIRHAVLVDVTEIQNATGYTGTTLANYIHTNYIDDAFLSSGNTPKSILLYQNNNSVNFKKQTIISNIVETDGLECPLYFPASASDSGNVNRYSDIGVFCDPYSVEAPTIGYLHIIDKYSPFYPTHNYVTNITITGATTSENYRTGGFCKKWADLTGNYVVIEKLVAKIPIGQTVAATHNFIEAKKGTYWNLEELSPMLGTGKYEEYTWRYTINWTDGAALSTFVQSGSQYWAGYIYTKNSSGKVGETGITWNVAYYANYKFDVDDPLQYFSVLPNKDIIKSSYIMTREINETNIYINGDGSDTTPTLPSKYKWISLSDNNEIHGNHAIMQPSESSSTTANDNDIVTPRMKINPRSRYKLTFRIWAKKSAMSSDQSFISAIAYYSAASDGILYRTQMCSYLNGTMTTLTQNAAKGDTVLHLSSVSNWTTSKTWNGVGFRSDQGQCYHNKGYQYYNSTGLISAIDTTNNTITLKTGLSMAQSSGTIIVEALTGSTLYYPIYKGSLPDGEWKEYTIYIGDNTYWGGRNSTGNMPNKIPFGAEYMGFVPNLYHNWCGYPIIYDDIKLEEISDIAEKKGDCVSIKHFSDK